MNLEHIKKTYGDITILDDTSITFSPGEAVGILGVNGSGKSTLLNYIAEHYIKSQEVRCGYVPQENPLFPELAAVDNIRMWTSLNKKQIIEALHSEALLPLGITEFMDRPVKKLSGGMKKRLSIASVLINDPGLLLMDEPLAALDLPAKQDIVSYMRSYLSRGNIVIIASHEEEIFHFCNRVYLLKHGKLIDTAELSKQGISYLSLLRDSL